ncbi:MAG TPA: hypothetical protein VFW85_11000 [Gaiellaceae bacterium]|nr:hypothetical protein [Gaiellaceae bacterium]
MQTFGYPFPLHIFTRLGMAVVHLKRAHYLRYLVSLQKAERLRRYSVRLNDKRAPYQDLPVALDTRILISTFEACEHEDAVFSNHFHGHPRYLAWEYSELFDEDGRVGPAFLERFCALLGIDNTWATAAGVADAIPNTVKLPSEPLEVAISNFDEVRQTLKGTRWESLLEDERAPRPTPPAQRAKSAQRTPRRNAPGDYSDFVVLLARQRSGSNALLTALEAHDEIATFLTVIAPRHASDPNSFFRFVAERSSGAPAAADHAALFPQFLDRLREVSPKRISVLEVKPNTVSQIVSPYHTFVEPLLFELIDAHGIRVLHLTRENYLRSMLSAQKARRLGSWHVTATAGPAQDVAAELNTRDMLRRFAEWSREDEAIRQRFADSDNYLGCEYTQLFDLDTGELTTRFRSDLGAMLGIDTDWPALPAYRKGSHLPLEQAIENYEEVAAALRGTEFEAFLDDEPSYRTHVAQSAEEPTA